MYGRRKELEFPLLEVTWDDGWVMDQSIVIDVRTRRNGCYRKKQAGDEMQRLSVLREKILGEHVTVHLVMVGLVLAALPCSGQGSLEVL